MSIEKDLSKDSVARQLLLFALPFILTNFIQSFYGMADMMIAGQFAGTESMSGVNIGSQLTSLITTLAVGLSTGGTVLIGQYQGAGETHARSRTISTLFFFLTVLALVITGLLLLFLDPLLHLMQTPPEAFEEARRYLLVTSLGTVFVFLYNAFCAVLRGVGNSRLPLLFVSVACVVNIGLDLILVLCFHMGALGTAIATVFSQAISVLLCVLFLLRNPKLFPPLRDLFRCSGAQLTTLLRVGVPTSAQNAVYHLSFLVITAVANTLGVAASAGVGAVSKFASFATLPVFAIDNSISAMSAQNIGAGEEDRAVKAMKIGMLLSFAISLVMFFLSVFFPYGILRIFSSDPATISKGMAYLHTYRYDFFVIPIIYSLNGLFIGAGHSTFPLINSTLASLVVRIPVVYLLGIVLQQGMTGVGLAAPIATAVASVIGILYFFSGKWKIQTILNR